MNTENNNVCIIGLGYVGLTLATFMASKGFNVFGVERNKRILEKLKQKEATFFEPRLDFLLKRHIGNNFFIHDEIPDQEVNIYIITVGTPIDNATKTPIFEYITDATEEISKNIIKNSIVILRSTVAVGTTRNIVYPILSKKDSDVMLAFCPERTIEGKALVELPHLPQIIGGINQKSVEKAESIFRNLTHTIIKVSSLEVAELIKLSDNSYRDVKFAFANELALICKNLNVNPSEVIHSANISYARTDIPMPGFVGGACLSKDPYILNYSIKDNDKYNLPKLILNSRNINEKLPKIVLDEAIDELNKKRLKLSDAKVFISGLAFKGIPETDDLRNSPTIDFLNYLKNVKTSKIYAHDFVVKDEEIKNLGLIPSELEAGFKDADLVFIMNNHKKYANLDILALTKTMKKNGILFDCWHFYNREDISEEVIYKGI